MFSELWHDLCIKLGLIKPHKMYQRLRDLTKTIYYTDIKTLQSLDRISLGKTMFNSSDKYEIFFNSDLGTVKIVLKYEWPRKYILEYSNYAGTNVFTIVATETDLMVQPKLTDTLTAKEIDLALHEFESYLKVALGTAEEIIDYKKNQEKINEQEVKKLMGK